jgi:aspartate/methionine/tyrosine aminotransferase
LPLLRQCIAERLAAQSGYGFDPADGILVTHGGRGAFHVVADTYLNRGDRVVLFDPSPPLFVDGVHRRGVTTRWVATTVEDDMLACHGEQLRRAMAGSKMVLLSEPANPTGGRWSNATVDAVCRWARRFDVLVVLDRCWAAWDDTPSVEPMDRFAAAGKRLLVIDRAGPFSVGFLAADASWLRPCVVMAAESCAPVPAFVQLATAQALSETEHVADRTMIRGYVVDRLTALGYESIRTGGGPFVWVDVRKSGMTGRRLASKLARREGILVAPGDRFGPSGRHYLRVTWAGDEGRLREGLRRLEAVVGDSSTDRSPALVT